MTEPPATRPSLLVRIRDQADRDAWAEFVELYAPLIYGLARRRGLQDADAADVTQEVFRSVAAAVKRLDYDAGRGSFRGYLYAAARNKVHDFLQARRRQSSGSGDTAVQALLEGQPARDEEADWDRDFERRLFHHAAAQVRGEVEETTWQAFWQLGVEGKGGDEVAQSLGLSVGAVYVAKSRVLARLKQRIRQLQQE